MMRVLVVCMAYLVLQVVADETLGLRLSPPAGPVQGKTLKLEACNDPVRAFLGIPYAKPPTGKRRFQAPEPMEPWKEVYQAVRERSECAQLNRPEREFEGEEDCLFLNIYTPQEVSDPLPVLVLLHAGTFDSGSGRQLDYGPDQFLNSGQIVYVSLNYRVGPLGYLSTGSPVLPGNAALKDQVLVLEWLKKNIATFGGDPDKIVLIGEEAGAIQSHVLLLSKPELVTAAISLSGSAMSPWGYISPSIARHRAFALGKRIGCAKVSEDKESDEKEQENLVLCLQRADPKEIVREARSLLDWQTVYGGTFVMTLEDQNSKDPVLLVEPHHLVELATQPKPWMAGVVNNEGLPHVLDILVYKQVEYNLNKDPVKYLPLFLGIEDEDIEDYASHLWFYYFGKTIDVSRATLPEMEKLTGDALTVAGVTQSAIDLASHDYPVYVYRFFYNRHRDRKPMPSLGVPQGADARLLFPWTLDEKRFDPEGVEKDIIGKLLAHMLNFISKGDPNDKELSEDDPEYWPPLSKSITEEDGRGFRFLEVDIKSEIKSGENFFADRMLYWNINLHGKPIHEIKLNRTRKDHDEL